MENFDSLEIGAQKFEVHPEADNDLKADYPDLFEEGPCTAKALRLEGLLITNRFKFSDLLKNKLPVPCDDQSYQAVFLQDLASVGAEYLVVPFFEDDSIGDSISVLKIDELKKQENDFIYPTSQNMIFYKTFSQKEAGHHPIGEGDGFWVIAKRPQDTQTHALPTEDLNSEHASTTEF